TAHRSRRENRGCGGRSAPHARIRPGPNTQHLTPNTMVFSPFDYNEASRHREEGVEERLREGSPIVGVSYDAGLLLLSVRQTQRKIFEVYDRIIFSAIGKQADIGEVRGAAVE